MTQLQHIAITMDGNRRWAKTQKKPTVFGYIQGAQNIKHIALATIKANVPYLTLYALSTENLKKRNQKELDDLFKIINKLSQSTNELWENNVRLKIIGDVTGLPPQTQNVLKNLAEKTKKNNALTLTLALNYGGRDDIKRACQQIVKKNIPPEEIDTKTIANHLDTANMPMIDLLIRTGGKQRLSNCFLWQVAYAELYFTDIYWPAFGEEHLKKAINTFHAIQRNFGK